MLRSGCALDRIKEPSVDFENVARTRVLIKMDEVAPESVRAHPVWPLCRGLGALGFASIEVHGAVDYLDALDSAMACADFHQAPGLWTIESVAETATHADVVIDLSNDPSSKALCAQLCSDHSLFCVSVAWDRTWMGVQASVPQGRHPRAWHHTLGDGALPLPPVARIAAGVALQEVLIHAGRIDLAEPPESEIYYNVASRGRTDRDAESDWSSPSVEEGIVEVVGAGGIGVHLLEALAPLLGPRCELRIFDPDVVGFENLPQQIAYSVEDIGRRKAEVITEKLEASRMGGSVVRPFVARYQDRPVDLSTPTLRVLCPDNWTVRLYANDLSLRDGVPLVDAGSSPLAAQQRTHLPGVTACLQCRIPNLRDNAAAEKGTEPAKASCSQTRAPTLPGTNMVIAGVLAAEALRALRPTTLGGPSVNTITFDVRTAQRFGLSRPRRSCMHTRADTPIRLDHPRRTF